MTNRNLQLILCVIAFLLLLMLWLPLWSTRMEAAQYRGDEALQVEVYAGWIKGDIKELETLNRYIGVHMPLNPPELRAAVWVIGFLLTGVIVALFLPVSVQRRAVMMLFSLMILVGGGGAGLLQYRLYQMGHERSRSTIVGVANFTPPIFGSFKIANFRAHMRPELGTLAFLVAVALTGWVVFLTGRRDLSPAPVVSREADLVGSEAWQVGEEQ